MTKPKITLAFDEHNANQGTERGRKLLKESLEKLGAGRSIVCDRNGVVIGGNKTLEQAQALGITVEYIHTQGDKLIAVVRDDLDLSDNPKARELAYFDNRVAELDLNWSTDQLLADIDLIGATGLWTTEELANLQVASPTEVGTGEPKDPEDTPEPEEVEPRCKLGEVWQLGRHRLLCGSSIDEEQVRHLFKNTTPSCIWADPPYGVDIVKIKEGFGGSDAAAKPFGSKDKRGSVGAGNACPVGIYAPIAGDNSIDVAVDSYKLSQKFAPDAVMFYWGGNYYAHRLPPTPCWIIWDKRDGMTSNNFADAELAWTNQSAPTRVFAHLWNGMIKASERGERRVHPTQKPVALAEWCFDKYGSSSDIIFDPFLGSGMSIIAAEKMQGNRAVYGMELSPQYCSVVIARWEKFTGNTATRVETL